MYASTASITHNNGIQLSLEQTLAPSTNSGSSGSGSTSSTGTASSGDQPVGNGKVGSPSSNGVQTGPAHLNNAFYLNNLRSNQPQQQPPPPPPYANQFNRFHYPSTPASLPASVRATPTADFELYPRHLRTNSYTQATQHHVNNHQPSAIPQQIYNPVQSTPLHRRYNNNSNQQQNFQLRHLRSDSCNSILSHSPHEVQREHLPLQPLQSNSSTRQQLLYDKLHGRQSSSSAGYL